MRASCALEPTVVLGVPSSEVAAVKMPSILVDETQEVFYSWTPGSPGSPTLLFIHGLGSSNSFYAPVIGPLVKKGYSCLAFDTPGSGLSGYTGRDRSPGEIAQVAKTLVSTLELDARNLIVVGHSMGALAACELAISDAVRGVVLLGPVHPSPGLGTVFEARIKNVESKKMEVLAESIPTAATGSKSTPTQHAFIRALLLSQPPQGYISLCRTIVDARPPAYAEIKAPLLVLAGSDDKTSPLENCQKIIDSWGGQTRLEVLDGVGHWHCIEAADDVASGINQFANTLEG
ncbi:hypothetical protein ACJZ2D_014170 [Fusarium nematophilum]